MNVVKERVLSGQVILLKRYLEQMDKLDAKLSKLEACTVKFSMLINLEYIKNILNGTVDNSDEVLDKVILATQIDLMKFQLICNEGIADSDSLELKSELIKTREAFESLGNKLDAEQDCKDEKELLEKERNLGKEEEEEEEEEDNLEVAGQDLEDPENLEVAGRDLVDAENLEVAGQDLEDSENLEVAERDLDENDCQFNIYWAVSDLIRDNLIYIFHRKDKEHIDRDHAHSFEELLEEVAYSAYSFYLTDDDKAYYSEQELRIVDKFQKYMVANYTLEQLDNCCDIGKLLKEAVDE